MVDTFEKEAAKLSLLKGCSSDSDCTDKCTEVPKIGARMCMPGRVSESYVHVYIHFQILKTSFNNRFSLACLLDIIFGVFHHIEFTESFCFKLEVIIIVPAVTWLKYFRYGV